MSIDFLLIGKIDAFSKETGTLIQIYKLCRKNHRTKIESSVIGSTTYIKKAHVKHKSSMQQ